MNIDVKVWIIELGSCSVVKSVSVLVCYLFRNKFGVLFVVFSYVNVVVIFVYCLVGSNV